MIKKRWISVAGLMVATIGAVIFSVMGVMYASDIALALGIGLLAGTIVLEWVIPDPIRLACLLVFFLPFERIPSINVAGVDVRINTFIGLLAIMLLVAKVATERFKFRPFPAAVWLIP